MKNTQLALLFVLGILFGHVYAQTEYFPTRDSTIFKCYNCNIQSLPAMNYITNPAIWLFPSAMEDPITRQLKYYSNGVNVWNQYGNFVFGSIDTIPIQATSLALMRNGFIPGSFGKTFWVRATNGENQSSNNNFLEIVTICDSCQNYEGEFIDRDTFYSTTTQDITGAFNIIRHGNGIDWWIIGTLESTNRLIRWKMENDTLKGPWYQMVTYDNGINSWADMGGRGRLVFNKNADQLLVINHYAGMSVFDFDRNTGLVSNEKYTPPRWTTAYPNCPEAFPPYGDFSPNGRFLYLAERDTLYQLDLLDTVPWDSKKVMYSIPQENDDSIFCNVYRSKDGQVFISTNGSSLGGDFGSYLWKIPNPDSLWPQCGLDTFFFYLPYNSINQWGTPTNPDYDLGPITSTSEELKPKMEALVYPNPASERLVLELQGADWNDITEYKLMTLQGRECVFHFTPTLGLNTVEADVSHLSPGMYFLKLTDTRQRTKVLKVQIMR